MIRLAFPVYSRTTDLNELRRFHERATRIHAAVLLPLLSLLIVTAPDLVPWLFGERWAPAVEPVQILCVAGMIAAILTGYPQIMLAAGKPRVLLVFNVFLLALYVDRLLDRGALRHHRAGDRRGRRARRAARLGLRGALPARARDSDPAPRHRPLPRRRQQRADARRRQPGGRAAAQQRRPVFLLLLSVGIVGAWAYLAALYSLFPAIWNDVAQLTRRVLPAEPPQSTH